PTGRAGDETRAGGELLRGGGDLFQSSPLEAGRLRGGDPGRVGGAPERPLVRGADGAVGAGGGGGPVRRPGVAAGGHGKTRRRPEQRPAERGDHGDLQRGG